MMRIYLDTSVVGGCFDEEFQEPSRELLQAVRENRLVALISDTLIDEVGDAPQPVQDLLAEMIREGTELLEATEETFQLQEAYLQAGVVNWKHAGDALHVAQATIKYSFEFSVKS